MNLQSELEQLWNNPEYSLKEILEKSISILRQVINKDIKINLTTAYDILLKANTSLGFGSSFEDASLLLVYLKKGLENPDQLHTHKIDHIACLITGIILTLLSVDESTSIRKVPKLMSVFDLTNHATRCQIISKMFHETSKLIGILPVSFWSLELTSFLITQYCFLEQFDKISESEKNVFENIRKSVYNLATKPNEEDYHLFAEWKNRWPETSDYYRFTTMMIFGKSPLDTDTWLIKANSLIEN